MIFLIKSYFKYLAVFMPNVSYSLLKFLYYKPIKSKKVYKKIKNNEFLFKKEQIYIDSNKTYIYYRKGTGDKVLLVHGWSGYGLQFTNIIDELVNQNYFIITFDAIGHGLSKSNSSSFFLFTECIEKIFEKFIDIKTIISHSLGTSVTCYFLNKKKVKNINNIILISSLCYLPDTLNFMKEKFCIPENIINKLITLNYAINLKIRIL